MGHKTGDITTRLRDQALLAVVLSHPSGDVMMDAVKHIETLRKAGDALAAAHADDLCDCYQPECAAIRAAHDAWEEARRG